MRVTINNLLAICILSCLLNSSEGQIIFKNTNPLRTKYFDDVYSKYKIDTAKILFLKKEKYASFLRTISKERYSYFLGVFSSDTEQVDLTFDFNQDKSCNGRIINNLKKIAVSQDVHISTLDSINKKLLSCVQDLGKFNESRRFKVCLLISNTVGKRFKKDYENILRIINNYQDVFECYWISLDLPEVSIGTSRNSMEETINIRD